MTVPDVAWPTCVLCNQRVTSHKEIGVTFLTGTPAWCHQECALTVSRGKVTAMATVQNVVGLPDCLVCGQPFEDHDRPITTVWDATCEDGNYWRPSRPFRSKNWPNHLIVDSPRYSTAWRCAKQTQRVGETLACTCGLEAAEKAA